MLFRDTVAVSGTSSGLRVGLDITPMLSGLTGVARHTMGIERGLKARGVAVRSFAVGRGEGELTPGTRHLRVPLRLVSAAWAHGLPPRAERLTGPVDVVHSIDLDPPRCRAPLVVTIHDLAALDFPELHSPRAIAAAQRRLDGLDRATAILPNSHATADALTRHGVDPSRITVVHHAGHPLPEAPASEAGIVGPYLLAVGELALRKDYGTLFKAFAEADLPGYRLVVVGPPGFGADQVQAAAAASGLGERLVMIGRATDRRLSALYAGATALCLSSVEEGFGLPLVEAMTRGLPIIASDLDVVREVAGDAAVTATVGDARSFAAAMQAVVSDDSLRERVAAASWARREVFTWDATIDATIAAYERILT